MNAPASVRQFFKTVLQQVHHLKVDVIAGDANAATYKYYKPQECQDLHNSSVAIMLKEMQREVNSGRPFESKHNVHYSTFNHSSQLSSASDLDCCCMAILSWRNHLDTRLCENSGATCVSKHKVARKDKVKTARTSKQVSKAVLRVVLSDIFWEVVSTSAERNFLNNRTPISARFGQGVCGPVGHLLIL